MKTEKTYQVPKKYHRKEPRHSRRRAKSTGVKGKGRLVVLLGGGGDSCDLRKAT